MNTKANRLHTFMGNLEKDTAERLEIVESKLSNRIDENVAALQKQTFERLSTSSESLRIEIVTLGDDMHEADEAMSMRVKETKDSFQKSGYTELSSKN